MRQIFQHLKQICYKTARFLGFLAIWISMTVENGCVIQMMLEDDPYNVSTEWRIERGIE